MLGLSGNRGSPTASISARRRKTVARLRLVRRLLSMPLPVPLCRTRQPVARCPHRTSRPLPSRLTTRNDALCRFRALRWQAWPCTAYLCGRAATCARNPDDSCPFRRRAPDQRPAFVHIGLDFRPIMHHNGEQITTVVHAMRSQARVQKGQTERLTVTLGRGQRSRIAALAKTRRTSVATVIRWALDDYIAANGDDRPSGRTRRR